MFKFKDLLPFAFFAFAHALPPAGTYNIISRVLSPSGQELAITFSGDGAVLTLQPLSLTDKDQIFNLQVVNPNGMSMVSETDPEQRIALLSNALPSLLSSELSIDDGAFFNLLQGPNGLSIGGAGTPLTTFWVAENAIAGSEIAFVSSPPAASNLLQFWAVLPNNN